MMEIIVGFLVIFIINKLFPNLDENPGPDSVLFLIEHENDDSDYFDGL